LHGFGLVWFGEKGLDLLVVRELVLLPNVVPAILQLDDSAEWQGLNAGDSFGFSGVVVDVGKRFVGHTE
jgi:hypothetical protein